MRIVHIAPPWIAVPPKNYGGTEFFIYTLVEEQVAQGHTVTLLAPGDAKTSAKLVSFFPQSLIDSGVPWQSNLKAYYHLHQAVEYINDHHREFDIVHTNLSSMPDMYILPLTASLPLPHVMTLHSYFPFDRVQSWMGDADRYYMEWASSVPMVATSQHARAAQTCSFNFVGVVHHGLSLAQFQPTVKQLQDFFVWLGQFIPPKGPHLAIESAKKAGVSLVLAGVVDYFNRESVEYFENSIKHLIDGQQVCYIGPVNMRQKIDLLSRAKGFLNPIVWDEPFGMVMIESMAVGCPVISFARGAAPEIVVHGKNGFLVHDVDEMAHFIPQIDEINRQETRMYIGRHFSASAMVENYSKIYNEVIMSHTWGKSTVPFKSLSRNRVFVPGLKRLQAVPE